MAKTTEHLHVTIPSTISHTLQAISLRHNLPLSRTVSECLEAGLLAKGVVIPEHQWSADPELAPR
jgi:hypothetical protein